MPKGCHLISYKFALSWLLAVVVFSVAAAPAKAQPRLEPVDYYVSPFPHAVELDPIGYLLGRVGGRFEYRVDPLISRYFEVAYQKNLDRTANGIVMPSASLGFGERIYLRDNAAMVGLYAGVNLGVALINATILDARLSMEIGYKLPLGSKSHFFIEPELLIDAYLFHHQNVSEIFPYITIPFGYLW